MTIRWCAKVCSMATELLFCETVLQVAFHPRPQIAGVPGAACLDPALLSLDHEDWMIFRLPRQLLPSCRAPVPGSETDASD